MRSWIAGALLGVVAACGKADRRPDLATMKPEEACQAMAKRAWECKDALR